MQYRFCRFASSNQETLLKHCRLCHGKGANWPCIHTDCVCQLIGKLYYTLPYHSTTGPSNTLRPTFQSVPKIVIPVFFSIQNIQTIPLRWCRLWTRRLPRNLLHRKKHDIVVSIITLFCNFCFSDIWRISSDQQRPPGDVRCSLWQTCALPAETVPG